MGVRKKIVLGVNLYVLCIVYKININVYMYINIFNLMGFFVMICSDLFFNFLVVFVKI